MHILDDNIHKTSIIIPVRIESVFEFMSRPQNLSQWALGAWYPVEVTETSYIGTSLINGERCYVQVEPGPREYSVLFRAGPAWANMHQLITCTLEPAEVDPQNGSVGTCLTLETARPEKMDDDRWAQLRASHETEVFILKSKIQAVDQAAEYPADSVARR